MNNIRLQSQAPDLPSSVRAGASSGQPDARRLSLGVVIVNYRTADLTINCIDSLLRQGIAGPAQIVVVDNASPDGSGAVIAQARPDIRVIHSPDNGGFGAGVNIGVAALATELVLVLNPDTYFRDNPVDAIVQQFAQAPSLGVLGLHLINIDDSSQYSARRFYCLLDILLRRTQLGELGLLRWIVASHLLVNRWQEEAFASDWVMGTGFVVRRRAFQSVGCMDEGYFLYFEEVDLCARMWIGGWSVMALPQAKLVHEHQRSSKQGIRSTSGRTHLRSMLRFFGKFGVPWLRRPTLVRLEDCYVRWQARANGHALHDESISVH